MINIKPYCPALLGTLVVFILSLMPAQHLPQFQTPLLSVDKLTHLFLYFVLCLWWLPPLRRAGWQSWQVVVVLGLYGFAIEFLQKEFTNRHFEGYDILANLVGATIAAVGYHFRSSV